jgi:hypothetical protein
MKTYSISYNVGKIKYLVSFHDGVKKHKDGSPMNDIRTFKTIKQLVIFQKELLSQGFQIN